MEEHVLRTLFDTVEVQASQIDTLEKRLLGMQQQLGISIRVVQIDADGLSRAQVYAPTPAVSDSGRGLSCWPRYAEEPAPLQPNAGWLNSGLRMGQLPVVGYAVCGLTEPALRAAVAMVERTQRTQRNFVPLFLTDTMQFDVFRRHGYVFEYIPAPEMWTRIAGAEQWESRIIRRLGEIKQKWGLMNIVQIGPTGLPGLVELQERRLTDGR
jgi:hypothetical protein